MKVKDNRGFSLKLKLTVMYTFFMLLVTGTALGLLLSLSSREVLSATQSRLRKRVADSTEEISLNEGELRVDSGFYSVSGDIYLSLYDENQYLLYGKIPYGFYAAPELEDGNLRTVKEGTDAWYVYDLSFRLEEGYVVYIRGIVSVNEAEAGFAVAVRFALILLPSLVILVAFIGYRMTRRTLLPVKKMTQTVQKICENGDLSLRVKDMKEKKKRPSDEITALADTFDGMLARLQENFDREKRFTSDVSHELRTPVSVMMAQCGECLEDGSLTDDQRARILLIRKKAEQMSKIISELLFLARADQGRQEIHREKLNISELTELTVEEYRFLTKKSGKEMEINCEIVPDLYAMVDETLYIRMLSNLISNAVFYGKENGWIKVVLREEGDRICGTVADNGIGISPEELPHIWERFYRADASRQGTHSGLGLPMVKWIVEAHDGTVMAESVYGEGSTFRFSFPKNNFDL